MKLTFRHNDKLYEANYRITGQNNSFELQNVIDIDTKKVCPEINLTAVKVISKYLDVRRQESKTVARGLQVYE